MGQNVDLERVGSVGVRTRNEARGPRSFFWADGGAVALILELMSGFPGFPNYVTPRSSYRCGKTVRVVRYGRAFGEIESSRSWRRHVGLPMSPPCNRCVSEERPRSRQGDRIPERVIQK